MTLEAVQLRELAELMHLNALCGCGHSVRLHLVYRYCSACGCGAVRDCVEVDTEYERCVADAVAATLSPREGSGETLGWWLNASQSKTYRFGFSGFEFNKATIVPSRYTPGRLGDPLIFEPCIETLDTPTIDTSWGADRRALREYVKPRIVEPPISRERRKAIDSIYPLWLFEHDGLQYMRPWSRLLSSCIEVVDALPAEMR